MNMEDSRERRKHYRDDHGGDDDESRDKRRRNSPSPPQRRREISDKSMQGRSGITSRLFQASVVGAGRPGRHERRGDDQKQTGDVNIVISKPEIKDVFTQPDVMNRNKRLFGSLMGHLGSAQTKLERDSEAIKKQTEKLNEVAKKNAEEMKRLEALKKEEIRKATYESKISMIKTSFDTWKSQMETLSNFISTDVEPRVVWIPAHHNKTTKDLLSKRQEEVRAAINSIY